MPRGVLINNQYFNISYSLFPKNEMRFKGNMFLSSSDILSGAECLTPSSLFYS